METSNSNVTRDSEASKLHQALASDQIRLISLEPHVETGIRLQLETFDLNACPPYAALSYRWGDATEREDILVNGQKLSIHRSLAEALRSISWHVEHARSELQETTLEDDDESFDFRYFWMDGICIDQRNLQERKEQVRIMGSIFSRAETVLIHLLDGRCKDGMTRMRQARNSEDGYSRLLPFSFDGNSWAFRDDGTFRPFLYEPYWRRVWIFQEIALARRILIMNSSNIVPFAWLEREITEWTRLRDFDDDIPPCIEVLANRAGNPPEEHARDSLWIIVLKVLPRETTCCSDERDRIYSLLGLIDWSKTPQIDPLEADYSISTAELFRRVATRLKEMNKHQDEDTATFFSLHKLALNLGWRDIDYEGLGLILDP